MAKISLRLCKICKKEHDRNSLFCSKHCVDKNYRINHKYELKEYFAARWLRDKNKLKKYLRQYYIKNKRILREKSKIYRMLNAKKIALMKKRYSQNNKDKANENHMLRYYDDLYNQRVIKNSQAYAKNHNQRGECCEKCGSKKRLQFHHTNYEKNIGMTLCIKCHVKLHRGVYYETGN